MSQYEEDCVFNTTLLNHTRRASLDEQPAALSSSFRHSCLAHNAELWLWLVEKRS